MTKRSYCITFIKRIMKEKMTYEKPTVQKVEFDFKTRIAASSCPFSTESCNQSPS
jgi:hypothetical protein